MEKTLRSCADQIVEASIRAVLPDEAVRRALKDFHPEGRTVLVRAAHFTARALLLRARFFGGEGDRPRRA